MQALGSGIGPPKAMDVEDDGFTVARETGTAETDGMDGILPPSQSPSLSQGSGEEDLSSCVIIVIVSCLR